MMITDENGSTNVKFSTIWRFMAALAMIMLTSVTGLLFTWGVWITRTVNEHSTQLAVVRNRAGITQSVNVGAHDSAALTAKSAKTWLTTKDVAEREQVTERTVINYIEAGMIDPPPERTGKSWLIAEHFRIVPKDSECCGNSDSEPPEGGTTNAP